MKHPQVGETYANWRADPRSCAIWRIVSVGEYRGPDNGVHCMIQRMGGEWQETDIYVGDICNGTYHNDWQHIPTSRDVVRKYIRG